MQSLFWHTTVPHKMNDTIIDNLARVAAGKSVQITGFGKLSPAQRQHLQAYGLLPGRIVQVISQRPVTTILIEQTELAFETSVSREISVK